MKSKPLQMSQFLSRRGVSFLKSAVRLQRGHRVFRDFWEYRMWQNDKHDPERIKYLLIVTA